jgi:phosphate-selective porin OprO and OprP
MKKQRSWRSWFAIVVGFVAVTLGGFRNRAWSEDLPPPAGSSSGDLEQRVRNLERRLERPDEPLKSADGNLGLTFHAILQADGRFFVSDRARNETDQFLLRRVRPSLEATFYRDFKLVLVPDFANNASTALVDAYLDVLPWTFAKLRAGKFKPPIGLEHLQTDANTLLPERAYPSALLPSRDVGLQFSGEASNGALGYALAFTNGFGDNNTAGDTDTNDGKEGTVRLYTKPFKNRDRSLLQGLHLGFGASYAKQNVAAPAYRSFGQQTLFTAVAAAVPDGEKIRLAPELAWFYHAFGLLGEWAQSSQVYRVETARSRVTNQAWQTEAAYTLTGEDTTYSGVKPRRPFDLHAGGWGAWQLVARYEQLYLDPEAVDRGITTAATAVQRATGYAVGVNWYLNTIVRLSSAYSQTEFDQGAARGDRPDEKVALTRVQINF